MLSVCLIATCALYTRAFLDAVQSGMIRMDDVRRRNEDPAAYNLDYPLGQYSDRTGTVQSAKSTKSSSTNDHLLPDARA